MENDNLFKRLGELIGNTPISMDDAEQRFAAGDLDTGYDCLSDLLCDLPELLVVDEETGMVSSKYRAKVKPPKPTWPEGALSDESLEQLRELFFAKILPNTIKEGRARITDKTAEQILDIIGAAERLGEWGYNDSRAFVLSIMAPHKAHIATIDTPKGPAERIIINMPGTDDVQPEPKPKNPKPTPKPSEHTPAPEAAPAAKPQKISRYFFGHFAFFPNEYKNFAAEIADRAVGDDWFVIDEPGDRPMRLIESKLNINFALAVREILAGRESALRIEFDSARFDTGFVTSDGKHLIAHFTTNTERDSRRFQSWMYIGITEE